MQAAKKEEDDSKLRGSARAKSFESGSISIPVARQSSALPRAEAPLPPAPRLKPSIHTITLWDIPLATFLAAPIPRLLSNGTGRNIMTLAELNPRTRQEWRHAVDYVAKLGRAHDQNTWSVFNSAMSLKLLANTSSATLKSEVALLGVVLLNSKMLEQGTQQLTTSRLHRRHSRHVVSGMVRFTRQDLVNAEVAAFENLKFCVDFRFHSFYHLLELLYVYLRRKDDEKQQMISFWQRVDTLAQCVLLSFDRLDEYPPLLVAASVLVAATQIYRAGVGGVSPVYEIASELARDCITPTWQAYACPATGKPPALPSAAAEPIVATTNAGGGKPMQSTAAIAAGIVDSLKQSAMEMAANTAAAADRKSVV